MSSRADYGIDSPAIVGGLAILACIAFGAALSLRLWRAYPVVELGLFVAGAYFFLGGCGMIWYSKVGKLRIRNQILQHIAWRGDEFALDVGCGRGLLLVGAARQLTSGKAIGVDRWVTGTLTGNRPKAALENARAEGVLARVEVQHGDVRQLPFADASFHVVLSNFVLHELKNRTERQQMLSEVVRVLKPGGRLALMDFIFTSECKRVLIEIGIADAGRERVGSSVSFWLNALFNFGLVQIYLVTGSKKRQPANESSNARGNPPTTKARAPDIQP